MKTIKWNDAAFSGLDLVQGLIIGILAHRERATSVGIKKNVGGKFAYFIASINWQLPIWLFVALPYRASCQELSYFQEETRISLGI